ncbi:pyruvate kinase [Thermosipho melanesiensis]|uniref:Pyruvate kinase n=2 Tax=Thermosipho melanesiensis TaxID=46541 RepID=A6LLI2_THEM4|nr:pyruvate kinase [Thermosipho melanesiensis]ABR30783.1 pyruvate kinase [Thermosipho melanesiensis BI429]APT73904.1 pyruvate kinase [Thermosipho melanesiensis]OOC35844.1 pyruvate kinase [Thermosipho melanesiensis]OOC38346.1 pyruvate kinase [Thermosipho melanesiensis]OOC38807.1 pyruvate kinase [Thermosipho melanesiensis]
MRKTRIVSTIGPATESEEMLEKLIKAGVNVFRLNSSHDDLETHRIRIKRLKKLREKLNAVFAILIDLSGPKIRTGKLKKEYITLKEDSIIEITTEDVLGDEKVLSVNYMRFPFEVKKGDKVLINDGAIELEVLGTKDNIVEAKVVRGGKITHHRGVNLPGVDLSISAITEKDKEFIRLAIEENIDFIALSFVRKPEDVKLAKSLSNGIPIIAKIETAQALEYLQEIILESDGVMVARGDLGVEIPLSKVPIVQKQIIEIANRFAKPVITATQMLESMIKKPTPTRAEVSDIANAILDGTDAIMLSAETSIGNYPIEAVNVMNEVAQNTEKFILDYESIELEWIRSYYISEDIEAAISHAVYNLSKDVDARLIITATGTGRTAINVARLRPSVPIMAATPNVSTLYKLSLVWGVMPVLINQTLSTDEMINEVMKKAKELDLAKKGNRVIITAGIPWGKPGTTNTLQIQEII